MPIAYGDLLAVVAAFERIDSPAAVLDALHQATVRHFRLHVLGAGRFPLTPGRWSDLERGRSVFIHSSAPKDWWSEYTIYVQQYDDPGALMARQSLAPFTWTERLKINNAIGLDRWPYELAQKHGMRDGFTCAIGGRWLVSFWSPKALAHGFTPQARAMVYLAAAYAAMRLESVVGADPKRISTRHPLTARELATLRLLSKGQRTRQIAQHLQLGEETVRSHLKKAQAKLNAKSRAHAVAEAVRQHLIA
ncbi:MAG: LuxR family transcriptional regulator [Hyphomicrobiaceae bacterium]|nr:MAG: LuxR family transcriptional regulator [Hyphomicrobiaceae bacterium]